MNGIKGGGGDFYPISGPFLYGEVTSSDYSVRLSVSYNSKLDTRLSLPVALVHLCDSIVYIINLK